MPAQAYFSLCYPAELASHGAHHADTVDGLSRSKATSATVLQAANDPEGGLTTVIVRPRFVWGKGAPTLPCLRLAPETTVAHVASKGCRGIPNTPASYCTLPRDLFAMDGSSMTRQQGQT